MAIIFLQEQLEKAVIFEYVNHKNQCSTRRVIPYRFFFGLSSWHGSAQQWYMIAWDSDKKAERTFAMQQISDWRVP